MDEARVAAVHELQLETPIELTRLRCQRTLEIDYKLVQQRFVHAIVKEPSKVLIICRTGRIKGDPTVDPTGNFNARFRRRRWRYDRDFACNNRCRETERNAKRLKDWLHEWRVDVGGGLSTNQVQNGKSDCRSCRRKMRRNLRSRLRRDSGVDATVFLVM